VVVLLDDKAVDSKLIVECFDTAANFVQNQPEEEEKIVYILPQFFPCAYSDNILEFYAAVYQWFVLRDWRISVRFISRTEEVSPRDGLFAFASGHSLPVSALVTAGAHSVNKDLPSDFVLTATRQAEEEKANESLWEKATAVRTGSPKTWSVGVFGGTFDHIHAGHMLMLASISHAAQKLLRVGVTGDEMLKNKKYHEQLEPIDARIERVRTILHQQNPALELDVFPLHDPYGPTLEGEDLEVIVVSEETRQFTEEKINGTRQQNGLKPLDLISVPLLTPPDTFGGEEGAKLSSTQLRKMEWEIKNKSTHIN